MESVLEKVVSREHSDTEAFDRELEEVNNGLFGF